MTLDARPCQICGSSDSVPLHANDMSIIDGLDMSYRVASCSVCDLVFADRLPAAATYATYYQSLSKYDVTPSALGISATDNLRCAAAVNLLQPHVGSDARIADLGCGSGTLLRALREAGWSRLVGLDPAPGAPDQARSRFELDCVRCGTLDHAPALLNLASMDVVCLTGVLEHLPCLRRDLEMLVTAIGKRTRILVEVPALERFTRLPFEPYGEFSLEHIQYFSAASLARLFESLGFAALSLTYTDLAPGCCDSLFGLFARAPIATPAAFAEQTPDIGDYIARSDTLIRAALARIAHCPAPTLVIYGAGSHTARLLPRLLATGDSRCIGLVDSNPNLCGKYLGPLLIESPEALNRYPKATIVVSSFRAQQLIADTLRKNHPNPVLTLY